MKRPTGIGSFLLIAVILSIFIAAGCDENGGGGDNPFPPPNSLVTLIGQRGSTAPDGQATFTGFLRLAGPSKGGLVSFLSLEKITEDVRRLVLYLADTSGLTELARNGEPAPGGGIFRDFPQIIGVNDQAQVAFVGRTAESPDDIFGDTDGYYLSGEGGIEVLVREGESAPGGGTIFKLCIPGFLGCAYRYGELSGNGRISFVAALAGTDDDRALFIADSSGITELARKGDPVPGGNGVFEDFFDPAGPNESGQVAFIGRISGSSGGENDNEGIYIADESGVTELAREGDTVPGGNGSFGDFVFLTGLNDSGEAAFIAILDGTSGGESDNEALYIASEAGITELARNGEPAPGGGGGILSSILIPTNPNESGDVAFDASIEGGDEGLPVDSGIFLASDSGITKLIRVGDSGPGGVGRFTGFLLGGLNDSGQVIFRSRLFQNKSSVEGLYRVGPGSSVAALAQVFQPAPPDGSKLFRTIENRFQGPNNSGLAFFQAGLMNANHTYSVNDFGIFLAQ